MSGEVKSAINIFKELRMNGAILTLRQARKAHKCVECGLPIESGSQYYEKVFAGSGLGSLKFPDHIHIECLNIDVIGGYNGRRKIKRFGIAK